jgi:hypothetical protein
MKDLLYSRVAPTKHCTDTAFHKLCSVKQGPNQIITSFGAYIVTTCEGTDITDYNKRMLFWIMLHPEIHAAVLKGEDYLTFDACLEARVETETALCLNAKYNKAFLFVPKRQVVEKAGKDKGKGKAHHNSSEDCSHSCGSHGQGGQQYQQDNRSGAQGARVP